jgi:hypothetical protein
VSVHSRHVVIVVCVDIDNFPLARIRNEESSHDSLVFERREDVRGIADDSLAVVRHRKCQSQRCVGTLATIDRSDHLVPVHSQTVTRRDDGASAIEALDNDLLEWDVQLNESGMPLNYCESAGFLISGTSELPVDPSEYQPESRRPVIGCNQLICGECGANVRSAAGYFPLAMAEPRDSEAIYATEDWSTLPAMDRDPQYRLYVCKCRFASVAAAYPVLRDEYTNTPWRCGGHPPATFPLTIDGIEITRFSDLERIIRQHLEAPTFALQTFHERLVGTALEKSIPEIARRFLSDPLPDMRSKALGFFFSYPQAPGAERVIELATGDRAGFIGVPDARPITDDLTLETRLVTTFGQLWRHGLVLDAVALPLFRRDAQRPTTSAAAIEVLAERDPQWLLAHADEIAVAAPNAIGRLIISVYNIAREAVDLVALAKRAHGLSPEQRAATRKEITTYISYRVPTRALVLSVFAD